MTKIIQVSLGTANFGTGTNQTDSFTLLDTFASLGGRILDTANIYAYWNPGATGGESERVIGECFPGREPPGRNSPS